MAESGRNSAFYNRCAIDLPSSVPWHGVDQFLASKIYPIGFKQPDWRYSSRPFCHSSSGPSPHQRLAVGQLDALDRASNVATVGLLIAVSLSTRHRSPLGWLRPPGSSPAQRAVAQRLSALARHFTHRGAAILPLSGVELTRSPTERPCNHGVTIFTLIPTALDDNRCPRASGD